MLDDTPPFGVPIDIISLSNAEDAPIVIPFDIGLDGELDIAFLFFSRLGLGVISFSECISPGWLSPENSSSVRRDAMRSSYNVLKLVFAPELDCSSLGPMLDIIAFLLFGQRRLLLSPTTVIGLRSRRPFEFKFLSCIGLGTLRGILDSSICSGSKLSADHSRSS